ncbi:MAG: lipid-A-disaccharide synthase [Acidobacteria bacterium]|nr:lipid-A-disaccharide synthase [Acidobacteriota bacterium]
MQLRNARILISAGEASGEMYGAELLEVLRRRQPSLEFFGVGGERMRAAGCNTVVDSKDLAIVGITEIISHLPKIYRLFGRLMAEADRQRPDLAIVIDSPAFNWRVARQMHQRAIPTIYYVCPQFWAWRQRRVRLLRKYINKALVIFPFEEEFYRERGIDTTFVGHPLADLKPPAVQRGEYAAQYGLDALKHWITLMPGSRQKEVQLNLPTLLQVAQELGSAYEFLLPIAPTLDRGFLEGLVRGRALTLVEQALPALRHSRAGVIASGTATVEAAMMSTPFVMIYRVGRLTHALGRRRIKVPHLAMVNLIAGQRVVPELVQADFTAPRVVAEIEKVIQDTPERDRMLESLAEVKRRLRAPHRGGDARLAAERAGDIVLDMLGRSSAPG